jgi:hypothetical protein
MANMMALPAGASTTTDITSATRITTPISARPMRTLATLRSGGGSSGMADSVAAAT